MSGINLSLLPFPGIVETLSAEDIVAAMLADLQQRDPTFNALVESDPAYKILEICAYRETLIRQRVNDGAKACMLAYATGADLDNLVALFGVTRKTITPADPDTVPPTPAVMESDEELRARTLLALDGFSTAGPAGAYKFHALTVAEVLDASATSPNPGDVVITVLGRTGSGVPAQETLDAVEAVLTPDDIRPLTDNVSVQAATIVNFTVAAALTLYPGPDEALVKAAAEAAVAAYVTEHHRLGDDITRAGLFAALCQPGVQNVSLTQPAADIVNDATQAPYCTGVTVTVAGRAV